MKSLLMLHESRVTQEGALSRLRGENVVIRERLRVSIRLIILMIRRAYQHLHFCAIIIAGSQ